MMSEHECQVILLTVLKDTHVPGCAGVRFNCDTAVQHLAYRRVRLFPSSFKCIQSVWTTLSSESEKRKIVFIIDAVCHAHLRKLDSTFKFFQCICPVCTQQKERHHNQVNFEINEVKFTFTTMNNKQYSNNNKFNSRYYLLLCCTSLKLLIFSLQTTYIS